MTDILKQVSDIVKNLPELPEHPDQTQKLFTDEELDKLVVLFVRGADSPPTPDEILRFVRWAETARVNYALLTLFFKGAIDLTQDETGEVYARARVNEESTGQSECA